MRPLYVRVYKFYANRYSWAHPLQVGTHYVLRDVMRSASGRLYPAVHCVPDCLECTLT